MKVMIIFFVLLLFSTLAQAQNGTKKNPYKISVDVSGKSPLTDQISSYVNRGLRKLNDVTVADEAEGPHFSVTIVVIETKTTSGDSTGYAISMVITDPLDSFWFEIFLKSTAPSLKESEKREILASVKGQSKLISHIVITGPTGELEQLCEELVTMIDTKAIEPRRKFVQEASSKRQRGKKR